MLRIKRHKIHSAIAFVYVFFNALLLPFGLLYMHLLSPLFYGYLFIKKRGWVVFPLLLILLPFDIIHLVNGVDLSSFLVSNALAISTFIVISTFAYGMRHFLNMHAIFKQVAMLNLALTIIAIIVLFTDWKESMWYLEKFTNNVSDFPRLKMLTYEASYYSLILAPVVIFHLLKVLLRQHKTNAIGLLVVVVVPLLLSFSVGALASIAFAFLTLFLMHWQKVFYNRGFFSFVMVSVAIVGLVALIALILFPQNAVLIRLENIIGGTDSSMLSRTKYAFITAGQVARERSIWFGAGLGQIKMLVPEIAEKYYGYKGDVGIVRIPNAIGETLATFGIVGLAIRIGLIWFLYHWCKVRDNYFQTILFVFIFIYQFTGSFLVNMVEYVCWLFAFIRVFPEFDVPITINSKSP